MPDTAQPQRVRAVGNAFAHRQFAVLQPRTFTDADQGVAWIDLARAAMRSHRVDIDRQLGQQDHVGAAGDAAFQRNPAGIAAHGLGDHHAAVAACGGGQPVQRLGHHGHGTVEAEGALSQRQVVVDGLGYAHAGQRIAELGRQLRDLERGIGRVVAAVVEEPAHVVGLQHGEQALVLRAVGLDRFQLEPATAEGAAGCVRQRLDLGGAEGGGVDEFLAQRAEDAVSGGQDLDLPGPGGLQHGGGGGVDDGGDAAALGVEQSAGWHAVHSDGRRRGLGP